MRLSTAKSFQNNFFSFLKENFTFKVIFILSVLILFNLIVLFLLKSKMNAIGIGFLVAALLIVLAAVLYFCYRKRYFKNWKDLDEEQHILPYPDGGIQQRGNVKPKRGRWREPSVHRRILNSLVWVGELLATFLQEKFRTDELVDFYKNNIPSRPNGEFIDLILRNWYGNYDLLERKHDYIQWLFPNRTPGLNSEAPLLNDENAKIIRETPELKNRMRKAFEMMLDFYGMKLVGDQFQLAENSAERLRELNQWGNHNFLRISRILLSLKECGHDKLMLPWLKFLFRLIYQSESLSAAGLSFENHWISTLDAVDKIELNNIRKNF